MDVQDGASQVRNSKLTKFIIVGLIVLFFKIAFF
jgi:hypothetical protein